MVFKFPPSRRRGRIAAVSEVARVGGHHSPFLAQSGRARHCAARAAGQLSARADLDPRPAPKVRPCASRAPQPGARAAGPSLESEVNREHWKSCHRPDVHRVDFGAGVELTPSSRYGPV